MSSFEERKINDEVVRVKWVRRCC